MNLSENARSSGDLPVALRDGEKILIKGDISNAIFWKAAAIYGLALLIGNIAWELGAFLSLVATLTFIYELLLKKFLLLIVTNERIFFRSGLLKVDTVQVRIDKVESVEIQRTLLGHALGYGTVVLTGVGSRFSYIPYLANAAQVRDTIDDVIYQKEKKKSEG